MQVTINKQDINIIVEKKRMKNMYFRFPDAHTLYVTCPHLTTNTSILSFINKNIKPLSRMQAKAQRNDESDEYFCFKGKRYIRVFDESLKSVY